MARPPQAPLLAEDGPRQLQGVLGAALEVVGQREVGRDDQGPRVVADARARLETRLELRARLCEALRGQELARDLDLRREAPVVVLRRDQELIGRCNGRQASVLGARPTCAGTIQPSSHVSGDVS